MSKLLRINVSADDGRSVDAIYDHTKASAINTCPVYGIVRFTHHKVMHAAERLLAPEAGQAAHRGFAVVRLFQLGYVQKREDLMHTHGKRIFGEDQWDRIFNAQVPDVSFESNVINACHESVYTSGFVDDPRDKRRTVDSICELLTNYVRQWDFERWPVWIDGEQVGIEIPFSFLVEIEYRDPTTALGSSTCTLRYTGRVDGIHTDPRNGDRLTMHENKTASRPDDAWLAQWIMSHQITGYTVFASVYTKSEVSHALVLGSQLPVPRDAATGQRNTLVPRDQQKVLNWANWLLHTHLLHEAHRHDPLSAPRYTHSCNRYFRSCSYIALCDNSGEAQKRIFEQEMVHNEWSPLKEDSE